MNLSWQLVSIALVVFSLALAFWWYERSRPSTKLIAVVATLAALAALGRDAFMAVPDVKPITTIVLVSGIAFGAGPGFAVGAISALASNMLLGQGPWTPWQMFGWGLVGLIGALLGLTSRRRLSPLVLALACAGAAEVFNLVVDLFTWTTVGSHTLAAFVAVLGQAAVFDITHVVASFIFALAFGNALLRMLLRVRSRLQVNWTGTACAPSATLNASSAHLAVLPLVLCSFAILGCRLTAPATALATPLVESASTSLPASMASFANSRELSFLTAAQNSDGGFGGARGLSSNELYSGWVAMALAAAGRDPLSVRRGGHTVLEAIRRQASTLQGPGDLERTILALHACGVSVRSLPGGDPVNRLLRYRASDGSFSHLGNITAFAIFALRSAGYSARNGTIKAAAGWLVSQQDVDGGFGFSVRGGRSDVDDTAAVLQALVDAGIRSGAALARATAYLLRAQNLDGGYPEQPGDQSNAQSTAWAVQGLIAAGRRPGLVTRKGSRSPIGYLTSLLGGDGSVRYSRTSAQTPVWVTAQALIALAGKPFPVSPVRWHT